MEDKKKKMFDAVGEAKRMLQGFIASNTYKSNKPKIANQQPIPMTEDVKVAVAMKEKIDTYLNRGLFFASSVFLILLYCAIYT